MNSQEYALMQQIVQKLNMLEKAVSVLSTIEIPTDYVSVDGTKPLTADWDIGEDRRIKAEALRARDSEGLSLEDSDGTYLIRLLNGELILRTSATAGNDIIVRTVDTVFIQNQDGTVTHARINATSLQSLNRLGVGPTTPAGKAHIDQDSTTAAIPVLVLDQADVSEPMIEFETTVGTGNTIEAVGAKVLTTTHFLKVKLPDNSIAYIPIGTIA